MPSKRKCRACKEYWRPENGTPAFVKWCSYTCREALALIELEKVKKRNIAAKKRRLQKQRSENSKRKRAYYANHIPTRRKAAVAAFNKFIRLRDRGLPCISCGKPSAGSGAGRFDAGHYIPAGSCSALRFDEHNVNLQCAWNCNVHKSGNHVEYRKGLIKKYGQAEVARLEGPQPTVKRRAEDYLAIEKLYKEKCAELENDKGGISVT